MIVIDEAGLMTVHQANGLIDVAAETGAAVRLVGDPRQLGAVGRGGVTDPRDGGPTRRRSCWSGSTGSWPSPSTTPACRSPKSIWTTPICPCCYVTAVTPAWWRRRWWSGER